MAELAGNCLIGQSGGPTAVVNATIAGIVSEALNHGNIEEVYGALNGVAGLLQEDLVDLAAESQQAIRGLRYTPGAALGSCRTKLKKDTEVARALEVLKAHNIRYYFHIGDGDSQESAAKIAEAARAANYDLNVIGVPKTIDNDVPTTDHCPGYGSAAKFIATTVRELSIDADATAQNDIVTVVEVMGRNTGWLAAAATLAKRRDHPNDPPHLVYVPEVAFDSAKFADDVRRILKREKHCVIVVGEGLVDKDGNYVAVESGDATTAAQFGGVGDYLKEIVESQVGAKVRLTRLGVTQRAAAHLASKTDADEAFLAGQAAVKAAIDGESEKMITLVRGDTDTYTCETGLVAFADLAGNTKKLPREWINEDGVSLNFQFYRYATPLIQGEVTVPYENGIPSYIRLHGERVDKQLSAFEG
ncbi:MAG: 6-phosphofructokinase [Candidatus Didemnitutus sp.]|nr:6-phosphofructokinase [Candidatus Didemnitutus sp.]